MAWATLLVQFGDSAAGETAGDIALEIDDRPGGLNGGKTSFVVGDQPGYLLYLSPGLTLAVHVATTGVIVDQGATTRDILGEAVVVTEGQPGTLRYQPAGEVVLEWIGGQPEDAEIVRDGRRLTLTGAKVAVIRAAYSTTARQFRLANVAAETAVIYAEAV
jgi:hypothetical protein